MIMAQKVHLFGYGKHGQRIAAGLHESGYSIHILEEDQRLVEGAKERGFVNVDRVEMTDDARIEILDIDEKDLVVCVMDDEHLNVFLTLTLRQFHPVVKIFSISDSIHTAEKLTMAGASNVIDMYQVSATRIHNFLNKPVTTHLLSGILGEKHDISFREYVIPEGSFLHGVNTESIDFDRFNLLFLGLIDLEIGHELIFVTEGINHKLDSGDILVFMGKDSDLGRFEETIKRKTI
jgi:voltage-gated potassium channel